MPDEAMLAVCWVGARLSTDQHASPQTAICQPISHQLLTGFPAHSVGYGPADHTEPLRFFLTPAEVEDIERRRHAAGSDIFSLYLGIDVLVAGLKNYQPAQTPELNVWGPCGTLSQVFPFWTTQVVPLLIQVERSSWVRDVLPGLGYDRSRLIELIVPPPLPDHTTAGAQFDKARRALDERRYGDCILECRGLLNMWERQFGTTKTKLVADVVQSDRGWPAGDIRRRLLDTLWKEIGDVANAPHHPEGNVDAEHFDARDARLILLLTSALSEYVAHR